MPDAASARPGTSPAGLWAQRADAVQGTLAGELWDERRRLHRLRTGRPLRRLGRWNYWWQAHALDAAVDAYARRPSPVLAARIDRQVAGILARGGGSARNEYYDDMGWLALGLLHADGVVPLDRPVEDLLEELVDDIRGGWSTVCGGGVAWSRRHRSFKNVPATGPAAILAARWSVRTRDPELLGWAVELVRWLHATLVDADGVVWDGTHERPGGRCEVERAEYTYCYGLVTGADLALGVATGEPAYVDRARRTAGTAVARMTDPATGLWRDEGGGDGGLFKGILARHLADLALATADRRLAQVLADQGEAAWRSSDGGLVGSDWSRPAPGEVDLSEHLAGVLLLEQCARLAAGGLLDGR